MAQYNHNIIGACQNIQREATDLAGDNAPFNLGLKVGALDFITSPDNMAGNVDTKLLSDNPVTKIKKLQIFYDQRTKPCQINTQELANVCTDEGSTPHRKEAIITLDNPLSTPVRYFDNQEMIVLCKDQGEFIRSRLFNDLRAARERFSQAIIASIQSYAGKLNRFNGSTVADTGTNPVALDLLNDDSGQDVPLPGNYEDIILDFQNMQLAGTPAIIGQGNFHKFMELQKMSCCNATTPYGEAILSAGAAYFFDQQANSVLGANNILTLPFGIIRLVTFNKNDNINMNNDLEQHISIPDPAGYPFKWNLDFKWDCDLERWKYVYSIEWTVFNVWQADSFAGSGEGESPDTSPDCTDVLDGSLGVFQYQINRS
jgi:hypothetical protein